MGNDLDTARAIDRATVGAYKAEELAKHLKALVAASLTLVAEVEWSKQVTDPSHADPGVKAATRRLAKVATRANHTLRVWGY